MEKQLRLNKFFYKKRALDKTIEAFSRIAKITYKIEKKHFLVFFQNIEKDFNIEKEFANYVLAITASEK